MFNNDRNKGNVLYLPICKLSKKIMTGIITNATIKDVSYVFHPRSGDIVPYLSLLPHFATSLTDIRKIPIEWIKVPPDTLCPTEKGVVIKIVWPNNPLEQVQLLDILSPINTYTDWEKCPVCGERLLPTMHPLSVGRCWNRSCQAQFDTNLYYFLGQLGLCMDPDNISVIKSILVRGFLHSLQEIFWLSIADLPFFDLTIDQIQKFIFQLHNIRGNITIGKILSGLHIPMWTQQDYLMLDDIWEELGMTLLDHPILHEENFQMEFFTEAMYRNFEALFGLESNARTLSHLCTILNC